MLIAAHTQTSELTNEHGQERFFCIESPPGLTFPESLARLIVTYDGMMRDAGLDLETEVMLRIHLSDIANQADPVRRHFMVEGRNSLFSMVGQPPASGSKMALEAYHIKAPTMRKTAHEPGVVSVQHGDYSSLWLNSVPTAPNDSFQQTHQVFGHLSDWVHRFGGKLENDVHRTWIYVRDVDNNYQGMVDSRRELFRLVGLNESTHYIASTGIEGLGPNVSDLLVMDSLTVLGMQPQQIRYMAAEDHLCPTHEYAVTFERGTQLIYGDRSHYYISGTASIDNKGNVLHVGDVARQCHRTLVNIDALLTGYGAAMEDIKLLVVYLRDLADTRIVQEYLDATLPPGIPRIMVRGAVCRPTWLVEMEAVVAKPWDDKRFSPFC